jgi:hypothetical protein
MGESIRDWAIRRDGGRDDVFLTDDATIVCDHRLGVVTNVPTQNLVTINKRRVLVEPDPEGKPIKGCPNYGPTVKPCTTTLKVKEGYSDFRVFGNCRETPQHLAV